MWPVHNPVLINAKCFISVWMPGLKVKSGMHYNIEIEMSQIFWHTLVQIFCIPRLFESIIVNLDMEVWNQSGTESTPTA